MESTLPPDPYKVLGVKKDSKLSEIRSAHRKLVLKSHPDKVQDAALKAIKQDEFQKIQQAYELLIDEDSRVKYDEQVKLFELRDKRHDNSMPKSNSFDFDIRSTGSGANYCEHPTMDPHRTPQRDFEYDIKNADPRLNSYGPRTAYSYPTANSNPGKYRPRPDLYEDHDTYSCPAGNSNPGRYEPMPNSSRSPKVYYRTSVPRSQDPYGEPRDRTNRSARNGLVSEQKRDVPIIHGSYLETQEPKALSMMEYLVEESIRRCIRKGNYDALPHLETWHAKSKKAQEKDISQNKFPTQIMEYWDTAQRTGYDSREMINYIEQSVAVQGRFCRHWGLQPWAQEYQPKIEAVKAHARANEKMARERGVSEARERKAQERKAREKEVKHAKDAERYAAPKTKKQPQAGGHTSRGEIRRERTSGSQPAGKETPSKYYTSGIEYAREASNFPWAKSPRAPSYRNGTSHY